MEQLSLLDKEEKQDFEVDKGTTVKLGKRSIRIYTRKKNIEAKRRLKEILAQLEGKDKERYP